jgi:hypothetical protein
VRSTNRLDTVNHNQLVFLQGFPSADSLDEIGARFKVDPEFFLRHLSFWFGNSDPVQGTQLAPPSIQRHTFQTSFMSVGVQDDFTCEDLKSKRGICAANMTSYLHNLRLGQGWKLGDSIVRSYNVHDESYFSIEQFATVTLTRTRSETELWTGTYVSSSRASS